MVAKAAAPERTQRKQRGAAYGAKRKVSVVKVITGIAKSVRLIVVNLTLFSFDLEVIFVSKL